MHTLFARVTYTPTAVRLYYAFYNGDRALHDLKHFDVVNRNAFTFATVSCHHPLGFKGNDASAMWRLLHQQLNRRNGGFILHVGDQVYMDDAVSAWLRKKTSDLPAAMADVYQQHWSIPALQDILANYPNYMMWDDHEIVNGWGSSSRHQQDVYREVFSASQQSYRVFQHLHNPDSPPGADGFYYHFAKGDCAFIALDLRSQRAFWRKQLLGDKQKAWIRELLADTMQSVLFVIASVPLFHLHYLLSFLPISDATDQWSHPSNAPDRKWLLQVLFDWMRAAPNRQVIVLGGDVHVATVADIYLRDDPTCKMMQITTSPISNNPASRVDRLVRRVSGRFEVHTENGECVRVKVFKRFTERNFLLTHVRHGVGPAVIDFQLYRENRETPSWSLPATREQH